jgi:hypothetical protein
MALSKFEKKRVEAETSLYVESKRPPEKIRDKVDLGFKIEDQSVIIFETRAIWNKPKEKTELPFAKATYLKSKDLWKIYWMRANGKWHQYEPNPEVDQLVDFLNIVETDEHCCFKG